MRVEQRRPGAAPLVIYDETKSEHALASPEPRESDLQMLTRAHGMYETAALSETMASQVTAIFIAWNESSLDCTFEVADPEAWIEKRVSGRINCPRRCARQLRPRTRCTRSG